MPEVREGRLLSVLRQALSLLMETTRFGWWWERFMLSRCFRHQWRHGTEYEDTGYYSIKVGTYRECEKCGQWERLT